MADIQRIAVIVANGHQMRKPDCDTLTAQVQGLQTLMNDLHAKIFA